MATETPIRFFADDVELDGRLTVVDGAARGCVVCHPHPLYGGDMNSSVVVAVTRALVAAGISTLRFDFRGVGASSGSHGGGAAEVEDARAAVAALAAATGNPAVDIAGYSFGSVVALQLASSRKTAAVVAIAPPLAMFDAAFVWEMEVPLLLLAGDRDAYCPAADFQALIEKLPPSARGELLVGGDHFLVGREREIGDRVADWMKNV